MKLLGNQKMKYRPAPQRRYTIIGRPKVVVAVRSSKICSFRRCTMSFSSCVTRRNSEAVSISRFNGLGILIAPSTRRGSPKPNSEPLLRGPWTSTGIAWAVVISSWQSAAALRDLSNGNAATTYQSRFLYIS